MGGERSALRRAAAGVAAAAGGVAREPRASEPGAGGAGVGAGDKQCHDRSVAVPDPQAKRRQRLAPPAPEWGLQRRAAAGAGSHVQGLGRPQRSLLAGDRPGGALRRADGGSVPVDVGGHRHCHRLEREPADRDARRGVVLTALQLIRRQLPFPLRGIDADNDPVFLNQLMEAWCDRPGQEIVLTRSRAYQSNDQACVEQKNGMLVRRVVGYQRLVSLDAAQVLGELDGPCGCLRTFFSRRSS